MPWTYVPGSEAPMSLPSVVSVSARKRLFCGLFGETGLPSMDKSANPFLGDVVLLAGLRRSARSIFASWSFHATALRRRMRLASLTRRRKRGSVARVRKVSLRILEYAGDAPR